jgi:hypothetical protein
MRRSQGFKTLLVRSLGTWPLATKFVEVCRWNRAKCCTVRCRRSWQGRVTWCATDLHQPCHLGGHHWRGAASLVPARGAPAAPLAQVGWGWVRGNSEADCSLVCRHAGTAVTPVAAGAAGSHASHNRVSLAALLRSARTSAPCVWHPPGGGAAWPGRCCGRLCARVRTRCVRTPLACLAALASASALLRFVTSRIADSALCLVCTGHCKRSLATAYWVLLYLTC